MIWEKMVNFDKYYAILDLKPGASEEDIKKAFRDFSQIYHPDKFPQKPHLLSRANKKMQEINIAYEKLKSVGFNPPKQKYGYHTTSKSARWESSKKDDFKRVGIKMVPIPFGSFQMGSNDDRDSAKPVHMVTLDEFEMSKYEITQGQYEAIMGENPSWFSGSDDLPVERVSWYDAVRFCNSVSYLVGFDRCYDETSWECYFIKNGYRLPTEAEWEYACRAGTTTKYYTGDSESDFDRVGWYYSNSGNKSLYGHEWDSNEMDANNCRTHPVGEKEPNAFGLYDMHGNVFEWCHDWFDDYTSGSVTNPTGPTSGPGRVLRGGSWGTNAKKWQSVSRGMNSPWNRFGNFGFRVVRRPGGVTY